MGGITIRIEPDAANPKDSRVVLVEADGAETGAALPAATLTIDWDEGVVESPAKIAGLVTGADALARQSGQFQRLAYVLYDWLLPIGPVRQRWDALNLAAPLPVTLDIRGDELAQLPWEMACSPPPQIRLAAAAAMQRIHTAVPKARACSAWPFRVLFIVGCSEADESALGVALEREKVERTFVPFGRSVDVQCLTRPAKADLRKHVQSHHSHVLHFAGHGTVDPITNTPGLRFDLGPTASWVWSSAQIPTDLLGWGWTPSFVFLNACRSSSNPRASWSVQRAFLGAGAKAALGMQADVAGNLAGLFAAKVYEECAAGRTVQEAVFAGRLVLRDQVDTDWWLPVLVSTAPELKLFEPLAGPADPVFAQCREFEHAKFFANCADGRRQFTYWLNPVLPEQPESKNVAILTGQPRSGKSQLIKWCMESWAMAGARVRYIEVHQSERKTFLSVLRQIRDGDSDGSEEMELLHGRLPETAFRRFNWELKNVLDTGKPGQWNEAQHGHMLVQDDGRQVSDHGEQRVEGFICASFLGALKLAAVDAPLVLVFDKLTGTGGERLIPQSEFRHLVQHLFAPIAREPGSPIKLVFVANQGQQVDFGLNALPQANVLTWDLPVNYSEEQMAALAAEMLWFQEEAKVKSITKSVLSLEPDADAPVGLARLRHVYTFIEQRSRRLLAGVSRMR